MQLVQIRKKRLEQVGRLQYFYHSPSSVLPIRDVNNELGEGFKTEPHIENGTENFLKACYQSHIRSHAEGLEKYLFLYTRCRNKNIEEFYQRLIVGYIEKQGWGAHEVNEKQLSYVQGRVKMVPFHHGILLEDIGIRGRLRGTKILSERQTKILVNGLSRKRDITSRCIDEIVRLDVENKTCFHGKDGFECTSMDSCTRYSK